MSGAKHAWLHLQGQYSWHGPARIVGTARGLEVLRAALEEAVNKQVALAEPLFASDGEGYRIEVEMLDEAAMQKEEPTYIMLDCQHAEKYWCERAFASEAQLHYLKGVLASARKVVDPNKPFSAVEDDQNALIDALEKYDELQGRIQASAALKNSGSTT